MLRGKREDREETDR